MIFHPEPLKKWPEGPWELSGWTVHTKSAQKPWDEQRAVCVLVGGSENAGPLIAQAPALVDALENMLRWAEEYIHNSKAPGYDCLHDARTVLSAVYGEKEKKV